MLSDGDCYEIDWFVVGYEYVFFYEGKGECGVDGVVEGIEDCFEFWGDFGVVYLYVCGGQ